MIRTNPSPLTNRHEPSRRAWLALVAVCMGFFVIQLDVTIVNVALPAIQRGVGGSLAGLQWIVDAYTVALASTMLAAGSEGDRVGARRVFLLGLALFAVASATCAAAPGLAVLVAARAAQGLGAAGMLPCSLALLVHQFPNGRARARALGVWGGVASLGLAAGPVVGGGLVALAGWRVIFLVNVPVCLVTAALVRAWVPEPPRRSTDPADRVGLVLGSASLGLLSGGFIEAGALGWTGPLPLGLLALGLGSGLAFVAVERRRGSPMLPLGLFRAPAFSAAVAVGVLFNVCLYGSLLCLSLFLQRNLGQSTFDAGLSVLPLMVAVGVGATASGRLTARLGPRAPMIAGMVCGALGAGLMAVAGGTAPVSAGRLPWLLAGSVVMGFCSLAMPAMTSVAVGAVQARRAGLASGVLNAGRQTGGALGVAVLGALFAPASGGGHTSLMVPLTAAAACALLGAGLSGMAGRARSQPEGDRAERPRWR